MNLDISSSPKQGYLAHCCILYHRWRPLLVQKRPSGHQAIVYLWSLCTPLRTARPGLPAAAKSVSQSTPEFLKCLYFCELLNLLNKWAAKQWRRLYRQRQLDIAMPPKHSTCCPLLLPWKGLSSTALARPLCTHLWNSRASPPPFSRWECVRWATAPPNTECNIDIECWST